LQAEAPGTLVGSFRAVGAARIHPDQPALDDEEGELRIPGH
jgi:hypothetical protein